MKVAVVWASVTIQDVVELDLPPGASVADAVARSGFVDAYAAPGTQIGFAIHGRRVSASDPVVAGDRIVLTRPLVCDPKAARVRRARAKPPPLPKKGSGNRGSP
jgi:putative ubiquitin-RnfH superfamily antitoxin RatB of RatAB toxin-antitoxin module